MPNTLLTVAQALASQASNLFVSDTAANIAAAQANPALVARVSSFTQSGPGLVAAGQALRLAALGPKFSRGGFPLTVQDSLYDLTVAVFAPGMALATAVTAYDTVANLLASTTMSHIAHLTQTIVSASAAVNQQMLTRLQAMPGFGVAAGVSFGFCDVMSVVLTAVAGPLANIHGIDASLDGVARSAAALAPLAGLAARGIALGFSPSGSAQTLLVADTGHDLAAYAPSLAALGTHVGLGLTVTNPSVAVNAADAAALLTIPGFHPAGMAVADTAAALSAQSPIGRGYAAITVTSGAFAAALPTLLDPTLHFAPGATATLAASTTVNAATMATVAALPGLTLAGGVSLVVADQAPALIAASAAIVAHATGVTVTAATTETVAQATALDALASHFGSQFSLGNNAVTVVDTAAAIAAANPATFALATTVQLAATAQIDAAQATAIAALGSKFTIGSNFLTVADSAAALQSLVANAPVLAAVNGWGGIVTLSGDATVTTAGLAALEQFTVFGNGGHALVVADTAANLIANTYFPTAVTVFELAANGTMTVAGAARLAAMPSFTLNGHALTITDTAADLLAASAPALAVGAVLTLSAPAVLSAAQAEQLAGLAGFANTGAAFTVADTLANLENPAYAAGLADAATLSLSQPATITVAQAAPLLALGVKFVPGSAITVSDTAANLLNPANASALALGTTVDLSAAATLTVASAEALVALAHFAANGAAPLAIADSFANLLTLAGTTNAILQATPIGLSADATVTVAQMAALAALPEYALAGDPFALNGHALNIVDTGAAIAAYTPDGVVSPSSYTLSASFVGTALQADQLAAKGVAVGGYTITIADQPTALLAASNASGHAIAAVVELSGDAYVIASQMAALAADPKFSTAGHRLVVVDTAENLLGLSLAAQLEATTLTLIGSQTVSGATLHSLAQIGIKFSKGIYTLTVVDTAANLAALISTDTALASAEILSGNATVTAATANTLASLPGFALGGFTLGVQDSVANLLVLSSAATAVATSESLTPGSVVTISVAQGAALAALPHFVTTGSTITVSGTVVELQAAATLGWQTVAAHYVVDDGEAALVAAIGSPLLAAASGVVLAADATVNAATAAALFGIANFSLGTAHLIVQDSAAAIAANEAVVSLATNAVVNDTAPISAASAEALAPLASAGKLGFLVGDHIAITDSEANLVNPANASGVALAGVITVLDTATNLVAAAGHGWGVITPYYDLSANATLTGAQASVLAGLGNHFAANGHTMVVADGAAAVVANGAALGTLGVVAQVTDSVAAIGANEAGLAALGSALQSVQANDVGSVGAGAASLLSPLAAKLVGPVIQVVDTASAVGTDEVALHALGAKIAVDVVDSASHVGALANAIYLLGSALTVTLTDVGAVSGFVGAELVQVAYALSAPVAVTDTGANVAANAAALHTLGAKLGAVTLSDGTSVSAATAAALQPIDTHLGVGVVLNVADGAAAIAANLVGLQALHADGRLGTVTDASDTVANVLANSAALAAIGAAVTISDTAAHVAGGLNALQALCASGVVGSIALSDGGTPSLAVNASQLSSDAAALAAISGPHSLAVTDSGSAIQADLTSGSSRILADRGSISSIVVDDLGTIQLTEAQIRVAGMDDGAGSVFAKMSGETLVVTGVVAADVGTVAALGVAPTTIDVRDTAANIQTDLASGSSQLVAQVAHIGTIVASPGGTITLTESQVRAAHVDDGAGSVLGKTSGETLVITGVLAADVGVVATLGVAPASLSVSDTAANIQADLVSGSSQLVAHDGVIGGIVASDGGTITLTAAQILAAGVDDSTTSVLAKTTGEILRVTGVDVAQIAGVTGLQVQPSTIAVADTAAALQADLVSGSSELVSHRASLTTIVASDAGTITLTEAQVRAAGIDDGAGSVLARMTGETLHVTGVAAADVGIVAGLGVAPASIAVADTAANIQAAIVAAGSPLLADLATVSGIAATDAGTITLTAAQILAAGVADGAHAALVILTGATIDATDVPLSDMSAINNWIVPSSIAVSDTAANIAADLNSGTGTIAFFNTQVTDITASDGGTIALTATEILAAGVDDGASSIVARIDGAVSVTGAAVAQLNGVAALPIAPASVAVSDTASNLQADIVAGTSSLLAHAGLITSIAASDSGTITLTETQLLRVGIDDSSVSILAKMTGETLHVTGVAAADIAQVLALAVVPSNIAISDTAANLQANFASLVAHNAAINSIVASDSGTITLTETQLLATGADDGAGSVLGKMTGETLHATNVLAADAGTVALLGVAPSAIAIADTTANIQADLASGSSHLVAQRALITGIVASGGSITLSVARAEASGVDGGAGSVFSKITGASLNVAGAAVADMSTLAALGVPPTTISVVDTDAHILADLGSGTPQLTATAGYVTSVTVSDASISVGDAQTIYNALHTAGITFNEGALALTGTAAQILGVQAAAPAALAAAASVTITNSPTGLTAAQATTLAGVPHIALGSSQTIEIADTAANLLNGVNAAGIAFATNVDLSAAATVGVAQATTLAAMPNFNLTGSALTIADTAANIAAVGIGAPAFAVPHLSTVQLSASATVNAATAAILSGVPHYTDGAYTLALQDNAANIAAMLGSALVPVTTIAVVDTGANIAARLGTLQSQDQIHGQPLTITATDFTGTPVITVNAATYSADRVAIDSVTQAGAVAIADSAANIAAIASAANGDTRIATVTVSDNSANVLGNLSAIEAAGSKLYVVINDTETLGASAVSSLLSIPNLTASAITIADTGSQIAAAIAANGSAGLTFLGAHTVELSANSVVNASEAATLETLPSLLKNGNTLKVWDTAAHLTDSADGYLAAVQAGIIDGVYLQAPGNAATITAATASVLLGITGFSKNNPNGTANTLTVSDTAAHLEASYASLHTHIAAIDAVVVSGSATITAAVLGDLQTLGASAAGGVVMTVRDSAADIVALAPTEATGHTLEPAAWQLSGSATISEAGAAYLGGLTGFSAGPYTLTLAADATISVADANALAALGSAFVLGGHHLYVSGTVATLGSLSGGALALVTPSIVDTFAHLAALAPNSPLLGGTETVTDSETVTAATAQAFLATLSGAGGSMATANVGFGGHIETVSDTVASLQTLTGGAAWTGEAAVHADFNLAARDTVANLIAGGAQSFLASVASSTISGNQTTTAANAETLAMDASAIHFSLGGQTITIQDTAANLLNPANGEGEALAATLKLSGAATVTTADAETLLTNGKLLLDQTLTVSDSAANLLDGVLAGDITGNAGAAYVHVSLAAPTTLDANTAEALVSLPGFVNNGNLSIADGSAYLLNAANHTALADATSVTLAGDETVSVATIARLAALPNFTPGTSHLVLASNDYANAAQVQAVADMGSAFQDSGHTVSLTQDAIALTPTEYTALQSDGIVLNGHALAALPSGVAASSSSGSLHVSGTAINGATIDVYGASGTSLSTSVVSGTSFSVTAADAGVNFTVTEIIGSAASGESAPLVVLDRSALETAVGGATFASSGQIQVDVGKYINLYTMGSQPSVPSNPVLVYDPTAHTISLDVGGSLTTLVTLGTATHPSSLSASEFFFK